VKRGKRAHRPRARTEEPYKEHLEKAQIALEILSNEHDSMPDIQRTILPSFDFIEAGKHISKLVTELKAGGYTVAIDITARALSSYSM
jgi:hypothetical protein